jgi:hypothetical protein
MLTGWLRARGARDRLPVALKRARRAARKRRTQPSRLTPPAAVDAPPGRVYTGDMRTPLPWEEPEPDERAQAFAVGFCFALAAVLLVLAVVI